MYRASTEPLGVRFAKIPCKCQQWGMRRWTDDSGELCPF